MVSIVRIHGNYCGANWTHGRPIPAKDYDLYPEIAPVDALDAACQDHDRDCSKGGCSAKGDRELAKRAFLVSLRTKNPIIRRKAQLIAAGITAASVTRSR